VSTSSWGREEAKKLCLELIHADGEDKVVKSLKDMGLWDNPDYWRYYGDDELNWNRAGNQQARSDFAVNEKVVNTIDSRLMLECTLSGINPEEPAAPHSMRDAVNRFIEKTSSGTLKVSGGRIEEWPTRFRTQIAEGIFRLRNRPQRAEALRERRGSRGGPYTRGVSRHANEPGQAKQDPGTLCAG